MMYQEAYRKLELEEVAKVLDIYNPQFDGSAFDPLETTIMSQDISFYPGMRYLDIADYSSVPAIHRHVIDGDGKSIVLDWTNEPIYRLNAETPISLNEETVADYVRFFFGHVRGKNGRFIITESVDDIRWRDDPPPAARKTIGEMLLPLAMTPAQKDGSFYMPVTVMFKDSLFQADVTVQSDGLITLDNEKLLVEDMPVLDDALGQ